MKQEIISRLEMLGEYVRILKGYQKRSLEEVKTDLTLRGAIERYLSLALECAFDIGEMVISLRGLRKPGSYREIIEILGEAGVLSKELAERFAPAGGFRNILIHGYARLDVEQVYRFLQENLGDFEEFAKQIARHLEKSGS
ncbi:MAG: DUF86 domain-containing protein [Candidatus Hadarchaeales archaeon]